MGFAALYPSYKSPCSAAAISVRRVTIVTMARRVSLFTVILRCAPKARLEGCTARAVALRGSLRSHLRVTVHTRYFIDSAR
jgi:hypothetical protein